MAFRMGGSHLLPKLISTSFRYTFVGNNFIHKVMFLLNHRWSFAAIVRSDCT
jgi:hypothetical protein